MRKWIPQYYKKVQFLKKNTKHAYFLGGENRVFRWFLLWFFAVCIFEHRSVLPGCPINDACGKDLHSGYLLLDRTLILEFVTYNTFFK